jgi:peptide/nickel transport system permease protein
LFAVEGVEDGRAFKKEFEDHLDGVYDQLGLNSGDMIDVVGLSDAPEKIFLRNHDWAIDQAGFDALSDEVRTYLGDYTYTEDSLELGTDQIGRDTASRMIYAARNTVGIALVTTLLSFAFGSFFGMLAAVLGGWTDNILSRIVDVLMSIPQLIFALLLLTILGANVVNMILVIALLDSTRVYRLMRAVGMNIVVMDYVEAAKLRGEGLWWLITKEILPNALAPLIAEFGLRFCFVFLTIAALSFLGLGIQPPTADWGTMVRDNAQLITFGQAVPLYPAGAIALLTVAVNFVVDWMLHRSSGLKE